MSKPSWDDGEDDALSAEKAKPAPKEKAPRGGFSVPIDYDAIKQEPWLVALNEKLASKRFRLDGSIVDELQQISRYRTVLPIIRSKQEIVLLQEENAKCLAHRDRVSEILVSYTAIKYALDLLWESAQSKVLELPAYQRLPNQTAREGFLAALLGDVFEKKNIVGKVIAMTTVILEHLNSTEFSLQRQAKLGEAMLGQKSA